MTLVGHVGEIDDLINHATGWKGLLDGLRHRLETFEMNVHVRQVKEKFGGLRFYAGLEEDESNDGSANDDTDLERRRKEQIRQRLLNLLQSAEMASYLLCYVCGQGVTHRGSGMWIRYFCPQHDTQDVVRRRDGVSTSNDA